MQRDCPSIWLLLPVSHSTKESLTSKRKLKLKFLLLATGGALAAGCVLGWSSPAEKPLTNGTEYGFPITDEQWSWVGSTVTLGAGFICLIIGTIINWIGRKTTMLLLIIPFTVGWAMVIWATSVGMLYFGRVLLGIAGGAFFVTAPL